MSEEKLSCISCGEEADNRTDDNEAVCNDCMYVCEHCEATGTGLDNWYSVDNERWCQDCTDSDANYCDRCEDYTSDYTHYVVDCGVYWCDSCTSYYANWCDECEHYTEDGCDSCNGDTYDGERVVHDYSYRPDPVFHTIKDNERLFFGFELEMELGYNRREAAGYAHGRLEPDDFAYLKNDGSLDDGFELVTHPMSFDFLMDYDSSQEVWETIEKLRTQIGRAHV